MKKFIIFTVAVVFLFDFAIAFSGVIPSSRPDHSKAIPMPLPDFQTTPTYTAPESRIVIYNIKSGLETEYDVPAGNMPPYQFHRGSVDNIPQNHKWGSSESGVIDNFTDLTLVDNPEECPFPPNCKIYSTFPTKDPDGWVIAEASAVLIGDNYALTAGHCIYNADLGGWAADVEVIPAYNDGDYPFGSAWATDLLSWAGWTQYGDLDHDMGVIRLDSPIGNLTKWYGIGYTDNLTRYQDHIFHNPGYPATDPYNGEFMYYWYGNFDNITEYVLSFNKEAYGGQSGSGAIIDYRGHGYTVAVLSHGDQFQTGDTRITSTKYNDILEWMNEEGVFASDNCSVVLNDKIVGGSLPTATAMTKNYPNPFNARTNIEFTLSGDSKVALDVYNIRGEKIDILLNEDLNTGEHTVSWDASDYPSGIYFYKLATAREVQTGRMMLIK